MEIRTAKKNEYATVVDFYSNLIISLQIDNYDFNPLWVLGVHPSYELLKSSVENDEMILALEGDKIVGAMIVNQFGNDGYKDIAWKVDASSNEIAYIHVLAISAQNLHRHIASEMIKFAVDYCKAKGLKVIRLDVIEGNDPARKLYSKCGFDLVEEKKLFYPVCNWKIFSMFEYNLCK